MLAAFPGGLRGGGHRSQSGTEGAPESGTGCRRPGGALHAPSQYRVALWVKPRAQGPLTLGKRPGKALRLRSPGARERSPGTGWPAQLSVFGEAAIRFPFPERQLCRCTGRSTQGTRAPGSRFPGHTSPSPAPALNPTTLPALRLLSLRDLAELLASPGLAGRAPDSAGRSAAAATAGSPCEIPAPTPDSEIAWSPLTGPSAPPPALHSTNEQEACQRVGGQSPLPQ